jgi:hypothetical protein
VLRQNAEQQFLLLVTLKLQLQVPFHAFMAIQQCAARSHLIEQPKVDAGEVEAKVKDYFCENLLERFRSSIFIPSQSKNLTKTSPWVGDFKIDIFMDSTTNAKKIFFTRFSLKCLNFVLD